MIFGCGQELAPRDRSLATIAALIGIGQFEALRGHIGRGLDNGLTQTELGAAVTHSAFYAGWPKAMAAVSVMDAAFKAGGK